MTTNSDRGNLNVLVVDDDEIVRFLHDLVIKESGLCPVPRIFSSGNLALDFLERNYRAADTYLIFLDINMPGMSGWRFLELIEEKGYKVAVVIVSSSIDFADSQKAGDYGVVKEYVVKPLSIETCMRIKQSYITNDRT